MLPLWVLVWKHNLTRRRRYIQTLCDILFPAVFFALIYMLCEPIGLEKKYEQVHYTEPFNLEQSESPMQILYTPETEFTNQLMEQVGNKLKLQRLDRIPHGKDKGYFPFSNASASSIVEYSKKMKRTDAIVIFQDDPEIPGKLNYTIRMKYYFATDQIELDNQNPMGANQYFGMEYEPFMRLQWAIDSSYIYLRSGANIDQAPTLQEFPYSAELMNNAILKNVAVITVLLPLALQISFIFLTGRLFDEKNSGMHELVKMAGVSWETITLSHVLDVAPVFLVYAVGGPIFFKVTHIVANTSGVILFIALALHFLTVLALAFVTVYIFNITRYIDMITMGVYSLFWVLSMAVLGVRRLRTLVTWLPHVPLTEFWLTLGRLEMFGTGAITFSNMWGNIVAKAFFIMLFQSIFLFLLAWYLSRVRPGKFGQALPWNFPFRKEYWSKKPRVEHAEEAQFVAPGDAPQYFEKPPAGLPVGIQINNVYKSFGKDPVLHGIDMAVYRGEITVLLGHNGAGKTTLISIITGLMSATSGNVLVEGKDTVQQAREVRKRIGLCPQHNIFFPVLTVQEHAIFFAMLKDQSYSQARATVGSLLAKLNLSEKANAQISSLSGGMKRRAQLACSISGGASVLVLDEPTSGLDVETRRELWNLLLSLRGDHTVLLTTHFMEEADALGDRIAALHNGVVRCHATPMFLKRAIGTGYRLSFTTIGTPKDAAITSAITKTVPDATIRDQRPNGVSYNLPAKYTAMFPKLFADLEERRSELGIDTIGVGKSTLDEVFMELCSDKPLVTEETSTAAIEPEKPKLTGAALYWRQFFVLLKRQFCYVAASPVLFLWKVAATVLLIYLFTSISNNKEAETAQKPNITDVALNLDLYGSRTARRAMVSADPDTLAALRTGYETVRFDEVNNVASDILRTGRTNLEEYNNYLVGIELNDTDAKALYTTTVRHAAPVALNLLSNAFAARLLGGGDGRTITTRNHPLSGAYIPYSETNLKQPKAPQQLLLWAGPIVMVTLFCVCQFSRLPVAEVVSGTRHIHVMAGARLPLHWAATTAANLAETLLACVLPAALCAAVVDADSTINQPGFLVVMVCLLTLGVLAFLGLVYLVSTLGNQSVASTFLAIVAFVFSYVTPLIPPPPAPYDRLLWLAQGCAPPHALAAGLLRAARRASINAYCRLNRDRCPHLFGTDPDFDAGKCCGSPAGSEPWGYWSIDKGAGLHLLILTCQAVVFFTLTYLSDSGFFSRWYGRLRAAPRPPARYNDSVVRAEAAYVEKAIKLPKKQITDAILVHGLEKYYPPCIGKKGFFAVKGISFSVKKGECFGLLGVNGAGKSTTFRMLTGDCPPSAGDIFANGHHLHNKDSYMQSFSYCPQFFGLDEFLTGRQNLRLLLTLRGLCDADVARVADSWIEEVGLSVHADKLVCGYSGGCSRRLAAAAALCQAAAAALLDEPSAGVDVAARRRLHRALLRARGSGALVVASHSLDEIEALCHRIAIMSDGELCALGSAAALKAQHAAGYSVQFKLASAQDVTDGAGKLDEFKGELHREFDCTLQDQHQTMLNYHINDTLRYSELFATLERLREQHPALVEDYTVTETTLEEVFLAFAREARPQQV